MLERLQQKISLFWQFQIIGWLAFGVAMTFSRVGVYPFSYMVVDKAVLAGLGILLSMLLRYFYQRLRRRQFSLLSIIVVSAICSYLLALPWTAGHNLAMFWYDAWLRNEPVKITRIFYGCLYHSFVLLAWSVLYFTIKNYQELQAEKERKLKAEASAQRERLRALRYQLNPHFLFNTLNAISTLIVEGQNRAATGMIARLSEFLRLSLADSERAEIPLVEELEFIRRYLEIEQLRFGDRLQVRFDMPTETLPALVPNLILQPLVENAIHHAITYRKAAGLVEITAQRVELALHLCVSDCGPEISNNGNAAAHNGVGLKNTRQRLEELYGTQHRFELQPNEMGGLTVNLQIPFRVDVQKISEHNGHEELEYENPHADRR
ncbi:MAG: sensor histidine kinase [bacterium]